MSIFKITNNPLKMNDESHLNILFVDDDSDENYLFNEALEHTGLSITLSNANNGNQLKEFLIENKLPDLVFLDLNMPYKDGLESLKEIRENSLYKNLKIIIYSTTKVKANVSACYAAGADLFIVKPDDFDGMVKVINQVCKRDWTAFERPPVDDGFIISPVD